MSEPVVEIVKLPFAADADITSGEGEKIWNEALKTIRSQPGCVGLYWGYRVETPDIMQLAVEWESLADHRKFEAQPYYATFLEKTGVLLGGAPTIFHIPLPTSTPFSAPGSAPVTECINLYFQKSYNPPTYSSNWTSFRDTALSISKEVKDIAGAWSIEEQKHEGVWKEEDGEEGPSFAAFIGWPSVEAHLKFRETEDFPNVVKYLRDGPKGVELFHVKFQKYE